jgi:hypothetical protein
VAISNQNITGSLAHLNKLKSELSELPQTIKKQITDTEEFVKHAITAIHTEKGKAEFRHVLSALTDVEHR